MTWLLVAGVCAQISLPPPRYVAELPAVLSFARTERGTAEVYEVRFKYGGEQTYKFFGSAYACQIVARQ